MAAPSKKRCKQGSLDGFFKKQRIDSDAGNYKLKCLNHCHNIIKSSKKGSFILNNCWKYEKNSTQKWSFNNEIKCQERPRMQDFAPFIPELLGALNGPQTPGRKGPGQARRGKRICCPHQFACYFSIFSCYFKIYWHPCKYKYGNRFTLLNKRKEIEGGIKNRQYTGQRQTSQMHNTEI